MQGKKEWQAKIMYQVYAAPPIRAAPGFQPRTLNDKNCRVTHTFGRVM